MLSNTNRYHTDIMIMSFAIAKLAMHFLSNANYGLHADEMYYIGISEHLQWGYYDNGPFIAWMVKLSGFLFGQAIFAWRILPSLASAIMVYTTGKLTQRLGGGKFAIVLSCAAMLCSPAFTATNYQLQPVVFDQLFWTLAAYCAVSYKRTAKPYWLYLLMTTLGLGFLNKVSISLYAAVVILPLLVTGQGMLQSLKQITLPLLTGFIIISPNLIWQFSHQFQLMDYLQVVTHRRIYHGVGDYLFQLLFFHGAGMAVWLAGLSYLLVPNGPLKNYLFAGVGFLLLVPVLFLLSGKLYYILGAFPLLFSAGGICWEHMLANKAKAWKWTLITVLGSVALIALPVVLPVLPYPLMKRYVALMRTYTPVNEPLRWEDGKVHDIPQYFSDMIGWKAFTGEVVGTNLLPSVAQLPDTIAVYSKSYAAAAAICYYAKDQPVRLIADDNSFRQWSPASLPENFIYISKEPYTVVAEYAKHIQTANMKSDISSSASMFKVYYLMSPTQSFHKQYLKSRIPAGKTQKHTVASRPTRAVPLIASIDH